MQLNSNTIPHSTFRVMKFHKDIVVLHIFFLFFMCPAIAQDTLRLTNGDELHGEIVSLNKSVLVVSTDYSDADFKIEWEKLEKISSPRKFTVFLSSREKLYATLQASSKPRHVVLSFDGLDETKEVALEEIVIIDPIKDSFAERFDASISSGLTLTKANNSKQFSIRATAAYGAKNWKLSANFNNVRNDQQQTELIKRTDASVNIKYLFYKNWFGALHGDFLSNTEQQLHLRSTQTVAIGNLIVGTNKMYLAGSAGLTLNRENYSNQASILYSKEAFLGSEFNVYDMGDLSLLTKLNYYPSLSEKKRYRINFSVDVKYDLPFDFFIKLGYTLNFDSRPPNEGTKDDYVFQSTLGWEF